MDLNDWSNFWWENITGPNLVVSKVVNSLLNNATVVIDVPSDLPWRQQMRSVVEDVFRSKSGSLEMIIETIDAVDDLQIDQAPGDYLLQQFGQNREVRLGYRTKSQRTIQDYLKDNDVLKNRIIWVKGLNSENSSKWLSFCKDYCHNSAEYGLFVLEIHGGVTKIENKNIQFIGFLECVSSYDVQLFSGFVVENILNLSLNWKKYISSVVASLCDTDAEVAIHILEEIKIKQESPLDIVFSLSESAQYEKRGANENSNHIFSYARKGDKAELEKRLWRAQVQTLFPIIEMERISIIEKYKLDLQYVLDNFCIEQYRIQITNPIELELGTLCYMMGMSFDVKEKAMRERIKFLHECRNQLAHAHSCSPEEVKQLLDYN